MTSDDIIRMAREAGMEQDGDNFFSPSHEEIDVHITDLERFAALVAAAAKAEEREACAKVAETLWQQYQDTKEAHERLSPEPFMPGRFGFDQSTVQQSRRIADAIRARGKE